MGYLLMSFPLIHKKVFFINRVIHTVFTRFLCFSLSYLDGYYHSLTSLPKNHTLFHTYYYYYYL